MADEDAPIVIAKPDTHKRQYEYMQLPNNIRAIVASDPACDKAGAALSVNAGMCYERKDLPGLAHFLEHMLFTGTETYPKEGEYSEFIQQNGGMCNANTMCYATNYMFSIRPESLEPALDRFARCFSEAMLTPDCTDREINAVDSEFQAGRTHPWWRFIGIMNQSANPAHPFHVACGNNKVLRDEPKERGIDLYDEMVKYYKEFYSANGMTVCVIGRESVEELKAMVQEKFAAVVDRGLTLPLGADVSPEPPFLPTDWNRLLLQSPAMDIKSLNFAWVLPYQGPFWKSKPAKYASHLLGHEGTGSLTAILKQRGLISGCNTSNGAWLEGAFSLFNVSFDLTDKGLDAVQEIGTCVFAYIALLQKTGVQPWIWNEMERLGQISFKFGDDIDPFNLAFKIVTSLQTHDPSEVLAGSVLLYEYDPVATAAIHDCLTLEGVRVTYQAKVLADRCTDKDTSYESPMKFEPLPDEWLAAWRAALDVDAVAVTDAALQMGLHFPSPNPFIPEDLDVKELPAEPQQLPARLPSSEGPVRYVFHRQDDFFLQPKARVFFIIRCPYMYESAHNNVCAALWSLAVEETLKEYSYDALVAGVGYDLFVSGLAMCFAVSGFHDKLHVLLTAVAKRMREMTAVPDDIFQLVADPYGDDLRNSVSHTRPIRQCGLHFSTLLTKRSITDDERLEAFNAILEVGSSVLDGVNEKLLSAIHVEAMALGNLLPEDAQALASAFADGLNIGPECALAELPEQGEARLPEGATVWDLRSSDVEDPNHAVLIKYQLVDSIATQGLVMLFCSVLSSKFFTILRTQQQLGYIVGMNYQRTHAFNYIAAQIQSEFHPDYVRGRINAFFAEHLPWVINELEDEEFQTCKAGVVSELQVKAKNLSEEEGRYSAAFQQRTYNFGRRAQLLAWVEEHATLDALKNFVRDEVLQAPSLCVQVHKVLDKEDKPLPEGEVIPQDPEGLRKWEGLEDVPAAFAATAEYVLTNRVID